MKLFIFEHPAKAALAGTLLLASPSLHADQFFSCHSSKQGATATFIFSGKSDDRQGIFSYKLNRTGSPETLQGRIQMSAVYDEDEDRIFEGQDLMSTVQITMQRYGTTFAYLDMLVHAEPLSEVILEVLKCESFRTKDDAIR